MECFVSDFAAFSDIVYGGGDATHASKTVVGFG